jgi:hypothetical protein
MVASALAIDSCALVNRHAVTRKKTQPASTINMKIQFKMIEGKKWDCIIGYLGYMPEHLLSLIVT